MGRTSGVSQEDCQVDFLNRQVRQGSQVRQGKSSRAEEPLVSYLFRCLALSGTRCGPAHPGKGKGERPSFSIY